MHRPVSRESRLEASAWRRLACVLLLILASAGCARPIRTTAQGPLLPAQLAELWVEPEPGRDLLHGPGGPRLAPDPGAVYRVLEVKKGGFSPGYKLADARGQEWSAKFYPEAHAEVAASRIHWGIGYHQPPVYLLDTWEAGGAPQPNPQGAARFRQERPDFHGLTEDGPWDYHQNPFVGTRPLGGLLVLQVLLGNSDLKAINNMQYRLDTPVEGASRWYVARDLGHSFGRTGVIGAPRDDPKVFDETPFIVGVDGDRVRFDYRGRHRELIDRLTVADVVWVCERLDRLTDLQWTQAFEAAGYASPVADRYITRLKQKIASGLALRAAR